MYTGSDNQGAGGGGAADWVTEASGSVGATANEVTISGLTARKHYRLILKITNDAARTTLLQVNGSATNYITTSIKLITPGTVTSIQGFHLGGISTTERTVIVDIVQTGAELLANSTFAFNDNVPDNNIFWGFNDSVTADITSVTIHTGAGTVAVDYDIRSLTPLNDGVGI